MSFGATQALDTFGPEFFHHGRARRFFLEMRVFEVSRCILLSQPSLLAQKERNSLTDEIRAEENANDWHRMDTRLDIKVSCSDFVVRYEPPFGKIEHCD